MAETFTFPLCSEVISQAISESVGSTTTQITANQNTSLIRKLDKINRDFINAFHTRGHSGGASWMEKQTNFKSKAQTSTNGALTTASTSIIFTADVGFDAAGGRVWIKTSKGSIDFVDYTAFAVLTATGVTGIDISHATAERVEKLYALPSDYAKAKKLIANYYQEYIYQRQETLPFVSTYYDRGGYIVLPEGVGAQDFSFWYEKAPTDLFGDSSTNSTDMAKSLDIPEAFMTYPVNMLCAYILRNRGKGDKAQYYEQEANAKLQEAITYDSFRTTGKGLQTDW